MKKQYIYSILGFILGFLITILFVKYMGYSNMGNEIQDLLKGCLPLAMFLSFIGFIFGNIQEEG
jgi:hypothetical protein